MIGGHIISNIINYTPLIFISSSHIHLHTMKTVLLICAILMSIIAIGTLTDATFNPNADLDKNLDVFMISSLIALICFAARIITKQQEEIQELKRLLYTKRNK